MDDRAKRRLAAVVAADVAGYTRLMEEDSEGTVNAWRAARDTVIDPKVAEHAGRLVKLTGDGFLAEFPTVQDAVKCAVAMQESLATSSLEFRMGVNLGDIIDDGEDIHGEGVNVAARLEAIAAPGGICISGGVHDQVRNRLKLDYDDLGEKSVKNVSMPVRVYAVRIPVEAPGADSNQNSGKPAIAVLPFANISGDPEQEYFSDGMTEDIITELSKISGLLVIARNTAFTYKGKAVAMKQVGKDLDVGYVLEGSVRKAGNRLRITAQLIDAASDHHLWAERYDRDLEDIFAIQDEVARSVAEAMQVALLPGENERVGRAPTGNLEAYHLYVRARSTPWPPTRENIVRARGLYQQVIDMDPDFAGGHAGKAFTYAMATFFGHSKDIESDAKTATELAAHAIERDSSFALSYSALGFANCALRNYDNAITDASKAVELQPGDADAHAIYGVILAFSEKCEEARREIETALRLDPQYVAGPYYNMLGVTDLIDGRYDDAVEALERNVARGGPIGIPQLRLMVAAYGMAGRKEEARKNAQLILEADPNFSVKKNMFFFNLKNEEQARRAVAALLEAGLPE